MTMLTMLQKILENWLRPQERQVSFAGLSYTIPSLPPAWNLFKYKLQNMWHLAHVSGGQNMINWAKFSQENFNVLKQQLIYPE